jgi:hypothetical protein
MQAPFSVAGTAVLPISPDRCSAGQLTFTGYDPSDDLKDRQPDRDFKLSPRRIWAGAVTFFSITSLMMINEPPAAWGVGYFVRQGHPDKE